MPKSKREKEKQARKRRNVKYQKSPLPTTRTSSAGNYIAASGAYGNPGVSPLTIELFRNMLQGYGFENKTGFPPENCSEAHLWMIITDDEKLPKHHHMTTTHFKKQDDPCENCRQWVYEEFSSVNKQFERPERLL